jgi:hypothetical protein
VGWKNRKSLPERVAEAAERSLTAQNYVSPIDVLMRIGWLAPDAERRWRQGRTDSLECVAQVGISRLSEAITLLRSWASEKDLFASSTDYVSRTPQRQQLRFSRSENPEVEQSYRTHWVSPGLSEKKRERLSQRISQAPELVVIQPLNAAWTCHRCARTDDLLVMDGQGPACLRCVGLDDLEFLPAGDASLTRRVKARSPRSAVVVRFSKKRKRYERQGLLVETPALTEVRREVEAQRRG